MKRTLTCFGYVCRGIGIAIAFAAGCTAVMAVVFVAGVLSARAFGLPDGGAVAFMVGYLVLAAGVALGIENCLENS